MQTLDTGVMPSSARFGPYQAGNGMDILYLYRFLEVFLAYTSIIAGFSWIGEIDKRLHYE